MIFKALTAEAVLQRGGGPSPTAERYRDILLVALTLTTGAVDAVTFVRLGKVTAVTGAALGALAALKAPGWVPAAVLIPVAVVLAGSLWRRPRPRAR